MRVLCALLAVCLVLALQACAVRFGVPRFGANNTLGPDRCDSGPLIERR